MAKEPLNKLVGSYNVARDAWLLYRGAIATSSPADPYLEQLNRNLASLMEAVKYNSLGQIAHALYEVGGEYRRNM